MAPDRIERDTMGEVRVPEGALWGAQTQRAIENFRISGIRFPREFIEALGWIKQAAALANGPLRLLDFNIAGAIASAAQEVAEGRCDDQFPLDIFQTGSATSTNMNANEVIANLAMAISAEPMPADATPEEARIAESGPIGLIHPNDHVNLGQSSNDVIPTAIHIAAALQIKRTFEPAASALIAALRSRALEWGDVVKTGRTHLMDAMPLTLGQELGGWACALDRGLDAVLRAAEDLNEVALGGGAVGTGSSAHPEFAARAIGLLASATELPLREARDHFAAQSTMGPAVRVSGALRAFAADLLKICNDLRLMNSGPLAGFGEIALPALQPGSSVMPGKVNPVIPEAVAMVCMEVMGADGIIAMAAASGAFQLNTALPLIAHHLLKSIRILSAGVCAVKEKAVDGMTLNAARVAEGLERNPILATALAPEIGYDRAAQIAKRAYAENRPIRDVAAEELGWTAEKAAAKLDPRKLTRRKEN